MTSRLFWYINSKTRNKNTQEHPRTPPQNRTALLLAASVTMKRQCHLLKIIIGQVQQRVFLVVLLDLVHSLDGSITLVGGPVVLSYVGMPVIHEVGPEVDVDKNGTGTLA